MPIAYTRGGGARREHPADKPLSSAARDYRKQYKKAREEIAEYIADYIARHGYTLEAASGGGYTKGGGAGRQRTGYDTVPTQRINAFYRAIAQGVALIVYRANQAAIAAVNSVIANTYADGANRVSFELRRDCYALPYTAAAVAALAKDDYLALPLKRIRKTKDVNWTKTRIWSIVYTAVRHGATPDDLPDIIARRLIESVQFAMDTTAQAAIYGAFDSGMYRAGLDAQSAGLDVEKTWLAIVDHRLRDSHRHLHLTTLPIAALFHGLKGTLRYPHDPQAPAAETYNCRCRLAIHLKGRAPKAPSALSQADTRAYIRWRDETIDALGGELMLLAEHRRRYNARNQNRR